MNFCYIDKTADQRACEYSVSSFTDKGPVDESAIPARNSGIFEGYKKCASTLPAPDDCKVETSFPKFCAKVSNILVPRLSPVQNINDLST